MATVNVYLTFNGNTEEAFNFYKSVFGGEFSYIGKFKDMPQSEDHPPLSPEENERIMHVSLPISKETILMGSDSTSFSGDVTFGNNFSVSINTGSREEADRLLKNRNEKWLQKLPKLMQNKSLFIAVGAGHLVGKDGLISRLKAMGYIVNPLATN